MINVLIKIIQITKCTLYTPVTILLDANEGKRINEEENIFVLPG
jgi:hypothetical protein